MNRVSILHLSDIHFESQESNYQDDKKVAIAPQLRESVFSNLEHVLTKHLDPGSVSVIAVTGDITTHGNKNGFDSFVDKLVPSLKRLVGDARAICIVPGNHDVAWNPDARRNDDYDSKFGPYARCVKAADATSAFVPVGHFRANGPSGLRFHERIPGPLYVDKKNKVIVLCINSAMRCGDVDIDLRDEVGGAIHLASERIQTLRSRLKLSTHEAESIHRAETQLESALGAVKRQSLMDIPLVSHVQLIKLADALKAEQSRIGKDWVQYVKIALLHHHLIPFQNQVSEHKPFEIMADSSKVLELLALNGFQIVLTGHKHQPYRQPYKWGDTEMIILGGLTVGGTPARGQRQGIRRIDFEQGSEYLNVRVADIECDSQIMTRDFMEKRVTEAPLEQIRLQVCKSRRGNPRALTSDRQELSHQQLQEGVNELVKYASSFKPETIVGINRGGAIVAGLIAKKYQPVRICLINVDDDVTSGKSVATCVERYIPLHGRVLLVDDAKRTGDHMREAYHYLRSNCKSAEIKTAVLLELDSYDPHTRRRHRPADKAAIPTHNSKLVLPWDPPRKGRAVSPRRNHS